MQDDDDTIVVISMVIAGLVLAGLAMLLIGNWFGSLIFF